MNPKPDHTYRIHLNPTSRDYSRVCAACAAHDVDQAGWLCMGCAEDSAAYRIIRPIRVGNQSIIITWSQS